MSTLNVDKVDPNTGTALEIGTSGDTITVPSGATFVVAGTTEITGTNNVQRPNVNPLIINGDMAVAQRATTKTGMKASGIWVCDRWDYHESGSVPEYTMTQESLTSGDAFEDGFSKSLKFDCTTAQASLSATEYNYMRYKFEGQNLQLFKKGTANAEKYTVSFWVKATKTGTNICEFYDNTNTRHCSIAYTVSSTNTWEKKVVNFPADTTGAIVATNALGMELRFWLLAGSNYSSGTLATTWAAVAAANSAVGQVNNADSTSNNWEIAGIQLEVGEYTSSTIPPFQHESYGDNLQRCQRYFNRVTAGQTSQRLVIGENVNTTRNDPIFQHHPPLRAAPSISTANVDQFLIYSSATTYAATNIVADVMNTKSSNLVVTTGGTMGAGNAGQFVALATAELDFEAEL